MIWMYRTLSLVSYLSLSCLTTVCNATSCRAGIVEASCKVYNISNIVRASSVTRWLRSLLFSSLRAVLRSNKASDILTVYCKISIAYSVTLVTLDNLTSPTLMTNSSRKARRRGPRCRRLPASLRPSTSRTLTV